MGGRACDGGAVPGALSSLCAVSVIDASTLTPEQLCCCWPTHSPLPSHCQGQPRKLHLVQAVKEGSQPVLALYTVLLLSQGRNRGHSPGCCSSSSQYQVPDAGWSRNQISVHPTHSIDTIWLRDARKWPLNNVNNNHARPVGHCAWRPMPQSAGMGMKNQITAR